MILNMDEHKNHWYIFFNKRRNMGEIIYIFRDIQLMFNK